MARPALASLTALLLALAGCDSRPSTSGPEDNATACADGADNDGDTLVDCMDIECIRQPNCAGGGDGGGPRPDAGPPRDGGPVSTCDDPIDVVFVIDVSTSMEDEVASIRTGIDSIYAATQLLTTNSQFSLVVFVDDAVAVNGCAPFASSADLQAELADWQDFTASNENPGGAGDQNLDCPENSLDAMSLAATSCPWRGGALHLLVHVTDDTFEERPFVLSEDLFGGGGVPVQRTYGEVSSALVAQQIRVGAFAAPGAGEECGAGSSPNVGRGFHEPFEGMPSLPTATGGRAWSIRDVRAGTLDMAEAINAFAAAEHCTLF